jgi:hypothetical protein
VLILIEHISKQAPKFWIQEIKETDGKPIIRSIALTTWQRRFDNYTPGAVLGDEALKESIQKVKAAISERDEAEHLPQASQPSAAPLNSSPTAFHSLRKRSRSLDSEAKSVKPRRELEKKKSTSNKLKKVRYNIVHGLNTHK